MIGPVPASIVRTMRYGSHPDQFARLHLPRYGSNLPVVVVVHGGFWRQRYDVSLADPLADDLAQHGYVGVAVEYRRVGDGGSGGWPQTLVDVATAVDDLQAAGQYLARGRMDLSRVAAVGHSAGGHLVGWLAHRGSLRASTPGRTEPGDGHQALAGVVSQAGVLDLVAASDERLGNGAVIDLMEAPAGSLPQRYQHASPLAHVGDGARVICVHGDADDTVPLSQSERYVDAAVAAGDPAELVTLPGVGHFELIDPAHEAWAVCRDRIEALLGPADAWGDG
jgi:acetyl esterase/lipase